MRTLACDPASGDIVIRSGRLQVATGAEAVREKLLQRLGLWRGSWFLDATVGVPYDRFLGFKGATALALAETVLRRAVATCPGVRSVERFTFSTDRTRRGSVSFDVTTTDGPVTVRDFVFAEGS